MKRFILFYFLLILPQTSCSDNSPEAVKILDLKTFRVEVPNRWRAIPDQGIDSQVGRLTNGKDVVEYDYGWTAYPLRNETSATHLRTVTTIDGHPALIVRPKKTGQGIIGLYVDNRLSLIGRDIRDESTVIQIFQSVRF